MGISLFSSGDQGSVCGGAAVFIGFKKDLGEARVNCFEFFKVCVIKYGGFVEIGSLLLAGVDCIV